MTTKAKATLDNLYQIPDNAKAEMVNGEVVQMSPTGARSARASFNIAASLRKRESRGRAGYAFGDNVGFVVDLPNRESFSPDAAWYVGDIKSMRLLEGATVFAAEVRSENDYGPAAEVQWLKSGPIISPLGPLSYGIRTCWTKTLSKYVERAIHSTRQAIVAET